MSRVIVIGAGLAGLSAACHLAGAGHDVTVLEREDTPGGRGRRIVQDGWHFDIGPTVMTMPTLLDDVLRTVGSSQAEAVPMRRLDPAYRAHFHDGSRIDVHSERATMRREIAATCGTHDAAAFDRFCEHLRTLYEVELPHFIDANFDSPLDLVRSPVAAARLVAMGGFGRLGPHIRRFFDDDRLQRLFSFQAMYAGLPPERALALYAVITYMDSISGVYAPEGGMGAIPTGMANALAPHAELAYGRSVTEVLRRSDGRVAGVRLDDGEPVAADAVVCTLDLPVAYRTLLPDLRPPRAVRRGDYSPSAFVWHLGVRGDLPAGTAHHNIHFGAEWNSSFDALIRDKQLMTDPSRLVTVPTVSVPGLAPHDPHHARAGHVLYVLEPVPNLSGPLDWTREREPMRDRLLQFLAETGYPTDVVVEQSYTPLDWQQMGMEQGTPFALAHTFAQTGPFRPPNRERRVPGLFFAGSGTVPGVGVPMVLISGGLAARRVERYLA